MRRAPLFAAAALTAAMALAPAAQAAAPDTTPPAVNFDPALHFLTTAGQPAGSPTALENLIVPAFIGWKMADPAGICAESGYGYNNDDTNAFASAPPLFYRLTAGVSQYNVFGATLSIKDCQRNEGSYGELYTINVPMDDKAGTYLPASAWKTSTCTCFADNTDHNSTVENATASFRYHGNSVALVSPKAPGRGKAEILVDGVRRGLVDFSNPTPVNRAVVFTWYQDSTADHTLLVRVVSGRVDIDAVFSD